MFTKNGLLEIISLHHNATYTLVNLGKGDTLLGATKLNRDVDEHRILKASEVQTALAPYYLIKLDLSHYDQSHEALLKQWNILGPPTYLFLNKQQQEIRSLRLTGAFSQQELLQQLASLSKAKDSN